MLLANKGRSKKELITLEGKISYTRTILVPADKNSSKKLFEYNASKSVCPVDDALQVSNLPFKCTCSVMLEVAYTAVSCSSFEEAAEEINKHFNFQMSTSLVQDITDFVGLLAFQEQCKEVEEAKTIALNKKADDRKRRKRKDEVLYLMTDGAMVYVRDKENVDNYEDDTIYVARRKNRREKTAGINDSSMTVEEPKKKPEWTESKHAICFHSDNIKYYFEDEEHNSYTGNFADALRIVNGEAKGTITGHSILQRDCIGLIGRSEVFKYHLLALANRNDWQHCSLVVIIADGAPWIRNAKDELFKGKKVKRILDLYHAKENAGKFANYLGHTEEEKRKYAEYFCEMIETGHAEELLDELKEFETKQLPQGVPNLYGYIKNNLDAMDYPSYKKAGLFVGSGAMESGNKYMMQDRMKLGGMKWNVYKARHMLCLKCHKASRTWNRVKRILEKYCNNEDCYTNIC